MMRKYYSSKTPDMRAFILTKDRTGARLDGQSSGFGPAGQAYRPDGQHRKAVHAASCAGMLRTPTIYVQIAVAETVEGTYTESGNRGNPLLGDRWFVT